MRMGDEIASLQNFGSAYNKKILAEKAIVVSHPEAHSP